MRQTTIPGTDLQVSRFVLGTASLLNAGNRSMRRRLLDAAADHGFLHFDTAPYYGFGIAENDLAPLLGRRPDLTVTTKVGLYPPGRPDPSVMEVVARKAAGRVLPALSLPVVDWSVERARLSLEKSLRRLGRDRIDFYALHEPELELLSSDEWRRWLEREVQGGRVRHFGISGKAEHIGPFLDAGNGLAGVVQTRDSTDRREADVVLKHGRPLQFTYGYMSGTKAAGVDAAAVLSAALERNSTGAVVVSTRRLARLPLYAELGSRP